MTKATTTVLFGLMSTPRKSNIMPLSPRVILNKFTIYHMNEIRSQLLHNYTALMQSPLTKRIERVKFRDIFLGIFLSFIFLAVRQYKDFRAEIFQGYLRASLNGTLSLKNWQSLVNFSLGLSKSWPQDFLLFLAS